MLADFRKDVQFFHRLISSGRSQTLLTSARRSLGSKGLFALAIYRMASGYSRWVPGGIFSRLAKYALRIPLSLGIYLSNVITKCDILATELIEPGVYLSGDGHIICGARSVGTGTIIHDRVTIGMNLFDSRIPEIGRNVWIGPGSIVYGNIKVGDGVTIMPGTVLTKSLPSGAVVQGNPARVVRTSFDNSVLRRSPLTEVERLMGEPGSTGGA